jgi:Tol biopolymer transport system component
MVDGRRAARAAGVLIGVVLLAGSSLVGGASGGSGDLIAFTRCRELDSCQRGTDIWVMRPDASALRRITRDGTHNGSPSWSPDGKRIVFVSGRNGIDQIWTMKADGSGMRRLTAPRALDEQPAWSPDGQRIAFVRKFSATRSAIYLIGANGTHPKALTPAGGDYQHLSWAPDGRRIAYSYARDPRHDRYAIYVSRVDGDGRRKLSPRSGADYLDPAWSPDGRSIAFSFLVPSGKTYTAHIEAMNAGGGNARAVARAPTGTAYFSPSWSPGGGQIVFATLNGKKGGLSELGIVDVSSGRVHTLTQLLGDNRGPAWRVVRRT